MAWAGGRRVNNSTWWLATRYPCAASKNGQDGTHRSAGPLLSRALPDLWPELPEVTGCSATLYATDTRQPAQLHSLRAGRLSSPTPPHHAYVCVLRWDLWTVRGPCLAVVEHVLRMRGRPGRRGGSKACLGVGASYHWYPWDLYHETRADLGRSNRPLAKRDEICDSAV